MIRALLLLFLLSISGCELIGDLTHSGDIARLEYKNGECKLQLIQGDLSLPDVEVFAFSETVSVDSECALTLEYNETEKADDD